MKKNLVRGAGAILAAGAALAFSFDENDTAVQVAAFVPGPLGEVAATEALGFPHGAGLNGGSFDVATLGVGGTVTLQLGNQCGDSTGADLLVCENPFLVGDTSTSFAETAFVEVSSDGSHFARFPTRYSGPNGQLPPIAGAEQAWYRGFTGVKPVIVNVPTIGDPFDVVHSGGDLFDLADLAGDPLVLTGHVDLQAIHFVRLVDIDSGNAFDSLGNIVWDCGLDATSSADIDAVVALNSDGNQFAGRPGVELSIDAQGFLTIAINDPDGWKDVKTGLTAGLDMVEFPFTALLGLCTLTQMDAFSFTLVTGPIPAGMFPFELRVGAKDKTGLRGGDAVPLP